LLRRPGKLYWRMLRRRRWRILRRELQRRTLQVGDVLARHLDQAVAPGRGLLRRELQAMTLVQ